MIIKYRIKKSQGFSIVELMIAILIGAIMMAALVTLFSNFSMMNRAQNGLARIQENGRYLTLRLKKDIENVGFQPCATVSMDSPQRIDRGFAMKPLISFTNLTNGLPNVSVIDTQYLIQGHECGDDGTCVPAIGVSPGGDPYGKIPDAGTTAGSRAKKTDVLTVRFLAAEAVNVDDELNPSTDTEFSLAQSPTLPPLELEDGDNILLANCYNAMIVNANLAGGNRVKVPVGGVNPLASVSWASKGSISSVYNFTKDFLTVSYYVGLKEHPDDANKVISSLYRVENGNAPQEIVEGVERLDFTYGVQFVDGTIGYLTADEIQSAATGDCIVEPIVPSQFGFAPLANNAGCLWRSVFAVRVNVLLNTVYNSSLSATESYIYSPDGQTAQTPSSIPSGTDPGKMYRKEFTETISLQSNNL